MYMFVLLNVLDSEGGSCPRSGESLDDPEELCEKIEKRLKSRHKQSNIFVRDKT